MAIRVEEEKRCKVCGKQRNHDVKEVHTTESNSLRKNRSRRKKAADKVGKQVRNLGTKKAYTHSHNVQSQQCFEIPVFRFQCFLIEQLSHVPIIFRNLYARDKLFFSTPAWWLPANFMLNISTPIKSVVHC